MDRIDIHMDVPAVQYRDLSSKEEGRSSGEMLDNVNRARRIQLKRFHKMKIDRNADMNSRQIRKFCEIGDDSEALLKIARTIADLEGIDDIKADHVAEAIQYRSLDRKVFR